MLSITLITKRYSLRFWPSFKSRNMFIIRTTVQKSDCSKTDQVTVQKVSLHLSLIGCWVEYHWFFPSDHMSLPWMSEMFITPFFQYLLTVVPSHHSHRLPLYLKMHLQQHDDSLNDCKLLVLEIDEEKIEGDCEFANLEHQNCMLV